VISNAVGTVVAAVGVRVVVRAVVGFVARSVTRIGIRGVVGDGATGDRVL
jgi:hypothetical protein